jgi:phenylpyruvate tautomerase PptA (4-oxalocrotonate tautomerase family)
MKLPGIKGGLAMPMLDAFIPEGALSPEAEKELLSNLTDILLRTEGADPTDPRARSIAVLSLHRPAAVYVAGEPAEAPRYRIFASVPQARFPGHGVRPATRDAGVAGESGAEVRRDVRTASRGPAPCGPMTLALTTGSTSPAALVRSPTQRA